MSLNFSALMCVPLPMPAEAKVRLAGLRLASAMRSAMVLKLLPAPTTSTLGWPASTATWAKSFNVS